MATEDPLKKKMQQISLADEDAVKEVLVTTVLNLWETVNNLTRLRPSKKGYRVSIFGSARVPEDSWVFGEVKLLARKLAEMGCDIVTGGGPGLMQAANEGAKEAGKEDSRSLGIRIDLPFEQDVNPFIEQAFEHRTFFTRLHQFVLMSDAFIVVPGGIGTILETMMIWQLLQVSHLDRKTPLILIGNMYAELVDWAHRYMLRPEFPLASQQDMDIPVCLNTAGEAIAAIQEHHSSWEKERGSGSGG